MGAGALLLASATHAEQVETVVVTATALPGATIDPAKIPANVQSLSSAELSRFGSANALQALENGAAGVSIADAQDNPLQPNLFYRGFEASPLGGDAQGLAVYVNGARLNQPFGDTVNWDLIPDIAISGLTLEGSNPVFGLNALGGSISVQMKNGFNWQGMEAEALGGSFGHAQGSVQIGGNDGVRSFYAAATALNDDGWRDHSPSRALQGLADFGWRGQGSEIHLDIIGAATALTGNGPAPVELLAADRSAVFTFPDKTDNHYARANLFGSTQIDPALSLQANVYLSRLRQSTFNGDASDAEPCGAGLLCLEDGTVLTDRNGNPIPDFLDDGDYAQLNLTSTDTLGFGGSLQTSYKHALFGLPNHLLTGASYDAGRSDFAAQSDIGALTSVRGFDGPGVTIDVANGEIAPVKVASDNDYYGVYAADILDVTSALTLSLSGRFNVARIGLHDRLGSALNGSHEFSHLNPAAGLTYKVSLLVSVYAGYAQGNRAPTPAEFSCADVSAPCSLTNFFVADPPLKQVVSHTVEAGARGNWSEGEIALNWHAGLYRVEADDDIMFVASSVLGRGFFRNIGVTRRQGIEASANMSDGPWVASLNYAYTDATFRSALTLSSPDNPRADAYGEIHVLPGASLPSVPAHTLKGEVTYQQNEVWSASLSGRYANGQYLRGDESNLNPKSKPYVVLGASARYRLAEQLEVFGEIENLLNAEYETFGTFSPVDEVPIKEVPNAGNPRSLSPAAPLRAYLGVRVWL